jgi:crotonobetainyl-CoA:carnitine CoA-transferase CaiB-like acyl-CoA transferase
MAGALSGVRVIDMTRIVAGPLAAQTLGDLGADVIKVERRHDGDEVRRVGPPWVKDRDGRDMEDSTYFQSVNRNKRSITIDFARPEGAELVRRLAADADVLIENFRTGTLVRYGLGFEDLRRVNPRLVYCSITGFGQTGPYAGRSGYDYLMQAMGGVMSVTGHADGEPGAGPVRVGIPLADIFAGCNAAMGIVAALRHRDATGGEGQHLDVALFDSQLASMLNPFVAWMNYREDIPRTGNHHPSAAPYGVFPASDGHILIATFNDREFARIATELGRPDWLDDPRFAASGPRVANRLALREEIAAITSQRPKAEWIARLNAVKISCGPINTMGDVERDPQVAARGMIVTLPSGAYGEIRVPGSPIRLSATPVAYRLPPPSPGEHTEAVLTELLGFGAAELAALRACEVI